MKLTGAVLSCVHFFMILVVKYLLIAPHLFHCSFFPERGDFLIPFWLPLSYSIFGRFAGFQHDKKNVLKELKKLPMMHDVEYVDYIQSNVLVDIPEEGIGSDTIVMP